MSIESAIRSAIDYEKRVVGVYEEAVRKASDPTGKKVFGQLADEEREHVVYLESKLAEWNTTGELSHNDLPTIVPSKAVIEAEVKKLQSTLDKEYDGEELNMLEKALVVESETSEFYEKMANELPPEGKAFFQRFVEIEEGHLNFVQSEIDFLSDNGFWMGIPEFDMEAMG